VKLNLYSLAAIFAITVPLGITTAVRKKSIYDNSVQVVTIIGFSLPTFIFAILFIFLFAIVIPIFPISGTGTPNFQGTGIYKFFDSFRYMSLPLIVMVFTGLGGITRYVRAAMIDALRMDYIRTARAKGLTEKVVIYSHAFRHSLIPFVTIFTASLVGLFGGSLMIESIFNWNGMGNIMITALRQTDFAVALSMNMFYALLALVGNLIMDLVYGLVDPRVRLS